MRRKGLWAEFHDDNKLVTEDNNAARSNRVVYVVYDASAYSYDEILQRISNGAHQMLVAIYYPERDMLITDREVISFL